MLWKMKEKASDTAGRRGGESTLKHTCPTCTATTALNWEAGGSRWDTDEWWSGPRTMHCPPLLPLSQAAWRCLRTQPPPTDRAPAQPLPPAPLSATSVLRPTLRMVLAPCSPLRRFSLSLCSCCTMRTTFCGGVVGVGWGVCGEWGEIQVQVQGGRTQGGCKLSQRLGRGWGER